MNNYSNGKKSLTSLLNVLISSTKTICVHVPKHVEAPCSFRDQMGDLFCRLINMNDTGADGICNAVQNTHMGQQMRDIDSRQNFGHESTRNGLWTNPLL